jgi:hypothetical protein
VQSLLEVRADQALSSPNEKVKQLVKTLETRFKQNNLSAASKLLWLSYRHPYIVYDNRVVSEKSIVLSWAVLKCSVHPTDREMYPCSVVDQFPGWIVHQRSRVDCSEFRYDGASDTTCPGQRSE